MKEFLEKNYSEETVHASDEAAIKLAIKALMEVVESGSKTLEVAVLKRGQQLQFLADEEIENYVKTIEEENKAETNNNAKPAQQQ